MTREEQRQLKRQKEKERRRKEREAWEAARGPMDLPFLLLAMLLLAIGLIMLLSASFPSAQASKGSGYDPLYYVKRQAAFAG
ncbi:MAG: cell division protein FtsW, partial [Oscillospiraceae bacterium]|nr:cell division protein FtsW [Oscillospiraceae bacterium]